MSATQWHILYRVSPEYRAQQFVETGEEVDAWQWLTIDPAICTPEERQMLLQLPEYGGLPIGRGNLPVGERRILPAFEARRTVTEYRVNEVVYTSQHVVDKLTLFELIEIIPELRVEAEIEVARLNREHQIEILTKRVDDLEKRRQQSEQLRQEICALLDDVIYEGQVRDDAGEHFLVSEAIDHAALGDSSTVWLRLTVEQLRQLSYHAIRIPF